MGNLSKHFSRYEITCNCGCEFDTMDAETIIIAEMVREHVKHPIIPISGCRCLKYNRHIESMDTSWHIKGRAMDLPVKDPLEVFHFLDDLFPDTYGIGIYDTFIHVDSRPYRARWVG